MCFSARRHVMFCDTQSTDTEAEEVKASGAQVSVQHPENTEIHKVVATWSSAEQSRLCGKHSCCRLGSPDGEDEAGKLTPQAWVCFLPWILANVCPSPRGL